MIFDVHAHCVPSEFIDLLRADGPRFGVEVETNADGEDLVVIAGRGKAGPFPVKLHDMAARLAAMDDAGVDVQLLSHRTDLSAYALDGDHGARYARAFNQVMADEVAKHPHRFVALGTVPLQDPKAAAEELRHAVTELGMAGVEIASNINGATLERGELEPFWEVANDLRCFVLLHPHDPLPGFDLSSYFLDNLVGRPAESTVAIAHLLFGGVLERYPDLVLCLVHGGGFLPYQLGRWQKGFTSGSKAASANLTTAPLELARRLYYDSLLHFPEALAFLVDLVGAEQVVVGSDYPYPMHERQPVAAVREAPRLTEAQRSLIFEGNVARILDGIRR